MRQEIRTCLLTYKRIVQLQLPASLSAAPHGVYVTFIRHVVRQSHAHTFCTRMVNKALDFNFDK